MSEPAADRGAKRRVVTVFKPRGVNVPAAFDFLEQHGSLQFLVSRWDERHLDPIAGVLAPMTARAEEMNMEHLSFR